MGRSPRLTGFARRVAAYGPFGAFSDREPVAFSKEMRDAGCSWPSIAHMLGLTTPELRRLVKHSARGDTNERNQQQVTGFEERRRRARRATHLDRPPE